MAAMAGGPEGRTAMEEAKQFLIEMLGAGEVPAKEVKAAADTQMISSATLRRAKSALGVNVKRDGFGPGSTLLWTLSSPIDAQSSHRCSSKRMSTMMEMSTYVRGRNWTTARNGLTRLG
jgi:hypothetical protein